METKSELGVVKAWQSQIDDQLIKVQESIKKLEENLAKARNIEVRLIGQRDLCMAFINEFNTANTISTDPSTSDNK